MKGLKTNKSNLFWLISFSIATLPLSQAHALPFDFDKKQRINNIEIYQKINLGFADSYEPQYLSADGKMAAVTVDSNSGDERAYFWNEGEMKLTDIGTLRSDKSGSAYVGAISADGKVVAGTAAYDGGGFNRHAFVWLETDGKMIDLGTLKKDNSGDSEVLDLSADGSVAIGVSDTHFNGAWGDSIQQAFIWHKGDAKMFGLGTLKADNSGKSRAVAVSLDGTVIVGGADTDSAFSQAFIWYEGDTKMTGLGTLKADNYGFSCATALSADGSVVAGVSDTNFVNDWGSDQQAFIWNKGDAKMTGLGTLKADNSGYSRVIGLSADGMVVAGVAQTDFISDGRNNEQAFIWHKGDAKMTGLGTLKADNSGTSIAEAMSADGRVIVGLADTDFVKSRQAFIWREGDAKITGLGTLRADDSGSSRAGSVSADGTVVLGAAETDSHETHGVIWKIKYLSPPEPPVNPEPPTVRPEIVIVDRDNSHIAMMDTANRGFKVLALYQSALSSLANARCQMGESNYCVGAFSQLDSAQDNSRVSTGLFGALKLPANNWTLGAAINFANQTRLIDNYDTRGSSKPGLGVFTRYQDNVDGSGLNIDISAAYIQQDITIARDKLSHTEAGKGESVVKGYQVGMSAVYAVNVNESTQLLPLAAITHHRVIRDGYSETSNAEFPATYGEAGNERTELQLGINARHQVNSVIQLDGGMGTKIKLNEKRDAFTGHINYIGAYAYDKGETALARPYVQAGVNFAPTKNSTLRVSAGFEKPDYTNNAVTVGLSYSYSW